MKKYLRFLYIILFIFPFSMAAQVTFTAQSATVNCETNSLSIDIEVDNFTNMNAFQYTLQWEEDILDFTGFSNNNFGVSLGITPVQVDNGFSRVSWFSTGSGGSTTLPNNTRLFTINFDLIGAASTSSISFNGNPAPIELIQGGAPIGPSQYVFAVGILTLIDSGIPSAVCPSDLTVDTGGPLTTMITGSSPLSIDNCGIDNHTYSLSGATTGTGVGDVSNNVEFNVGTTTVTYTANDFGSNTHDCSFDVTVTNASPSTDLEVFGELVSVNCENNSASVDIITNNFTDLKGVQFTLNWSSADLNYIDTSNIVFPNGFSFGGDNDNGELTFSWFSSTATTFPTGQVLFTINYTLNATTAGTTIPIVFTDTPTSIEFVDENLLQIPSSEYTVTDGLITIFDAVDPTISCPSDVTVAVGPVVNNIAPTTSDNCGIVDTTFTLSGATTGSGTGDASGSSFNVGVTTVAYTITDFDGNTATCSFNVTIDDVVAGTDLEVFGEIVNVNCENNMASVDIIANNFTDLKGVQFTLNWSSADLNYIDTSNIVFTNGFSFGGDNDNGELTFSWFSSTATTFPNGQVLFTINYSLNGATAGTTIPIEFVSSPTSIEFVDENLLQIPASNYTVTDGLITVFDDVDPTLTCPSDVTVTMGPIVNNISPTTSDNCGIVDTTFTLSGVTTGSGTGDASGSSFNVGVTNVTYTITDFDGNTATCSFNVTIENIVSGPDLEIFGEQVTVNCESNTASVDIIANNFTDLKGVQFTLNWSAIDLGYIDTSNIVFTNGFSYGGDNDNGELTFSWFSSTATTFPNGQVLFTINYNLNNTPFATGIPILFVNSPTSIEFVDENLVQIPPANYTVTDGLIRFIDEVAPTISCPGDLTLDVGTATSGMVNNISPTTSDNCGIADTTFTLSGATTGTGSGDASGTTFNAGITTVTYTVTDFDSNTASCSFNVTITNNPVQVIRVEIDSLTLDCNDNTAQLCIRVEDFTDIRGIQFTLNWNDAELQYVDSSNVALSNSNFGINNTASGILTYSWFSTGAVADLADGTSLFCINFDLVDPDEGDSYDVNFSNFPTPVQIITVSSFPSSLPLTDFVIANGNILVPFDTAPPTLSCPSDLTVDAGTATSIAVNNIAPTASDDCGTPTVTYELTGATTGTGSNDASSLLFNEGVTTVTYTAIDGSGNINVCNFTVTVESIPSTIITAQIDSLVLNCTDNTAELCIKVRNFEDVRGIQFTLNWDETQLSYIDTSQIVLTNANFGINDIANGVMTFSWFSSSAPVTLNDGSAIFCINFDLLDPMAGDSYDIDFSNVPTPVQIITVTSFPSSLPLTDFVIGNGNIMIEADVAPPTLTCPSDLTVNSPSASVVNNIAPIVSDDCGAPTVTYTLSGATTGTGTDDASGSTFNVGTTMVTYTATDGSGNISTCSFNVIVMDVLSITCPTTILTSNDSGNCSAALSNLELTINSSAANVTSIDYEISGATTATGTGGTVNETFNVGTSTVTFTVVDVFNTTEMCSFDVIVTDSEAPITVCPADVTVSSSGSTTIAVNDIAPTISDNCVTPNITYTLTGATTGTGMNDASGTSFEVGITTVTYDAIDGAGNTASCSFDVTVLAEFLSITCPADMTAASVAGTCSTPINDLELIINSDQANIATVSWEITGATTATGTGTIFSETFNVGVSTVTYTVTDIFNSLETCSFDVTITDDQAPLIICPDDVTVNSGGASNAPVNNITPIASDACSVPAVTYTLTGATNGTGLVDASGIFFNVGITEVTYTATDISGNAISCSFNVTIIQETVDITCPTDILTGTDVNACTAALTNLQLTVNSSPANISSISYEITGATLASGTGEIINETFNLGTSEVTFSVTDIFFSTTLCSFDVTIMDTQRPAFADCPADITISSAANCDASVTWTAPTATDNCDTDLTITSSHQSGDIFMAGTTTVTYVATDDNNNTDTCRFDITVNDTVPPVLFCPAPITVSTNGTVTDPNNFLTGVVTISCDSVQLSFNNPAGSDNCLSSTTTQTSGLSSGSTFGDGENILEYTITDDAGNTASCSISIFVESSTSNTYTISASPNPVCEGNDLQLSTEFLDGNTYSWTGPNGFTSDLNNPTVEGFTAAGVGEYTVVITEDGSTCEVSLSIDVALQDELSATIDSDCNGFACTLETCTLFGLFSGSVDSVLWTASAPEAGLGSNVTDNQITATPTASGLYTYTFTIYSNGCEASTNYSLAVGTPAQVDNDVFQVEFETLLNDFSVIDNDVVPANFTIEILEDVDNGTLTNNNDGTFDYNPNNGYLGLDQFVYQICLDCNDEEICRFAVVTLEVSVDGCLVPTVITPNDDGMNDELTISCAPTDTENELIIYNRWGDQVFSASPYQNDWKGTYNGENLPDGTYFFIYKSSPTDTDPRKGALTILR